MSHMYALYVVRRYSRIVQNVTKSDIHCFRVVNTAMQRRTLKNELSGSKRAEPTLYFCDFGKILTIKLIRLNESLIGGVGLVAN